MWRQTSTLVSVPFVPLRQCETRGRPTEETDINIIILTNTTTYNHIIICCVCCDEPTCASLQFPLWKVSSFLAPHHLLVPVEIKIAPSLKIIHQTVSSLWHCTPQNCRLKQEIKPEILKLQSLIRPQRFVTVMVRLICMYRHLRVRKLDSNIFFVFAHYLGL